jgi:hypothetical protein
LPRCAAVVRCARRRVGAKPGTWTLAHPYHHFVRATSDVADPGKTFGPQVTTENSQCEQKEFKLEPSGLTWRLQCRGQLDMDVAGQFIFDSPTRYSAFITSKATMLDRIVNETMVSISAERIGECR